MAKSSKPARAIQERLSRCRNKMRKAGIEAYLITNRADQVYLTGFDGEDGAALVTNRQVHIFTDGRFEEAVNVQAPWSKVHIRTGLLEESIGAAVGRLQLDTIHVQDDHVTLAQMKALHDGCRPVGIEAAPTIVNGLRQCKDENELKKIRRAISIAEGSFKAIRSKLKVGVTETEVAALIEYEMKKRGASGPSFPTIVAEGAHAALPHAEPGERRLKQNSLLLIDWGARFECYCSDLTRVLFLGKISSRLKRLYEIVLEAQKGAIAAIAPGKLVCDVDKIARDHICDAGYGDNFGHGLGHGLGLDIHESPRLKYGFRDKLEPGMVVTVEPGIYIPRVGGIRIEDDVLVTSSGHEVLTRLPKSLASAVV